MAHPSFVAAGSALPAATSRAPAPLQPQYHITGGSGALSDPNGLVFYRGHYHVFYQIPIPGNTSWGHVVSTDLAHWTRLPVALLPGPPGSPDESGAWSGSVTLVNGLPRLLYTCASQKDRRWRGYYIQQTCAAVPVNASDPLLVSWRKLGPVTMEPPPGADRTQFRDPSQAWQIGDAPWRVLMGTQAYCRGSAAVYESRDWSNWAFSGFLLQQNTKNSARVCLQYGDAGREWETPSAFPLPSASSNGSTPWLLIYGDQQSSRAQFDLNVAVTGTLQQNETSFNFTPVTSARALNGGDVYASSNMAVGARQLLFGYAREQSPNSSRGWSGVLTLPRELSLSPGGTALLQTPARELQALRTSASPVAQAADVALMQSPFALVLPPSPSRGRQRELHVGFRCPPTTLSCSAGVLITTSNAGARGDRTNLSAVLDFASARGVIIVDRSHTGGDGDARPQNASFVIPSRQAAAQTYTVVIFVDHSIVEASSGDGQAVVSSRIYPTERAGDWGLALSGQNATATVSVWELTAAFS